jgi:hypothetical protein
MWGVKVTYDNSYVQDDNEERSYVGVAQSPILNI